MPDWDRELNAEQLEAVMHDGGPLVVFAGAGSGKTRVITYRILHLILARSVRPSRILGLTFTNKAAGEMRERVARHLPQGARPPFLGTFHGFCARVLRFHGRPVGVDEGFAIYGEQDQLAVIRRVLADLDLDASRYNAKAIRGWIDSVKREGTRDVAEASPGRGSGTDPFVDIHAGYERQLEQQSALDFNDLILKTIELLEKHEETRASMQARYRHVLVDEFQDTNRMQMRLLLALAPPPDAPICVVGDDDQSIYRWRGADVRNILDFGRHYPSARTVTLTRNYRSTASILAAARAVIERNPDRAPKELWTSEGPGEPVLLHVAGTEEDEASFIARRMAALRDAGIPLARQAVLYRIHAQSRALEEALRSEDLPYRIVGGTRFFDRAEIRDLVAYLRLVRNPADDVAFLRVVNTPPRGIGPRTIQALREEAAHERTSLFEAARRLASGEGGRTRQLAGLCESVRAWHEASAGLGASRILADVIERTGYLVHLEKAHGPDEDARKLNVEELVAWAAQFELEMPDGGLDALCERIALHTELDEIGEGEDAAVLMTVHGAKGLEFDSVVVSGLEEDLFPYQSYAMKESLGPREQDEELQEERRLFYVAVTRARRHLALTSSRMRRLFGGASRYRSLSMFLDEIPAAVLREEHRAWPGPEPSGDDSGPSRARPATWVLHERFGRGRIIRIEEGTRRKLVIRFDDGRTRKILEQFVRPA
jgi:DNA helicase-2/ATP-dependent DNA helicase PcrA